MSRCGIARLSEKNCDWRLEADMARELLEVIVDHAWIACLLSDEHFSADGTMIEA